MQNQEFASRTDQLMSPVRDDNAIVLNQIAQNADLQDYHI